MKNKLITALALVIIGEILIILACFVLFSFEANPAVFILDLFVISACYLIIISNIFHLFPFQKSFDAKVGGLGVLWFFTYLYIFLAKVCVFGGYFTGIPFKYQLLFQAVLIFGFVVAVFVSRSSSDFASNVAENESFEKSGIKNLRDLFFQIEVTFLSKKLFWDAEKALIAEIKEKSRFLSPSENQNAKELEISLLNNAEDILRLLNHGTPMQPEIAEKLQLCNILLTKRNQFYSK